MKAPEVLGNVIACIMFFIFIILPVVVNIGHRFNITKPSNGVERFVKRIVARWRAH